MEKNVEDNLNDLSFEDALEELENITENFEDGNSTLEDAVNLYERGVKLKITLGGDFEPAGIVAVEYKWGCLSYDYGVTFNHPGCPTS